MAYAEKSGETSAIRANLNVTNARLMVSVNEEWLVKLIFGANTEWPRKREVLKWDYLIYSKRKLKQKI